MSEQLASRVPWARIAMVGAAVFVLTLTVLWFVFVHAPGPEAICARLTKLTIEEAGGANPETTQALVDRLEARCVEDKQRIIQYRGKIEYAEYARCVMRADGLASAEKC